MKNKLFISSLLVGSLLFQSCNESDDFGVDTENLTNKEVLTSLTNDVITATYKDLNDKAIVLRNAVNAFVANSNETTLQAVKQAWIDTRQPWEQSEGFLYGPVDTEGLDPAMDTWPVDVQAMNNILNSNQAITANLIASNNEARGFHLIEFLVWGEDGSKTADQINNRQKEYLVAAAQDLQNNTQALYNGWSTSGANYGSNFINAGIDNLLYPSQRAALEEIVEGLITIADEVANGKIEDPLNSEGNTPNAELEESRFSNNSKKDFADNMRSIQNIYLGKYNITGKGLSTIVATKNPSLDLQMKSKITEAIEAIEAIPGTFTDAIFNNRTKVVVAQEKVNELKNLIESQLKPYINTL